MTQHQQGEIASGLTLASITAWLKTAGAAMLLETVLFIVQSLIVRSSTQEVTTTSSPGATEYRVALYAIIYAQLTKNRRYIVDDAILTEREHAQLCDRVRLDILNVKGGFHE